MVAFTLVQRLTPNLALVVAATIGVLVTLAIGLVPGDLLEQIVVTSGIAAFVPAAEPPLGATARICVAVVAGGGLGLFAWFALSVIAGWAAGRRNAAENRPAVRRADAHPDAPPRQPLRAGRDFGYALPDEPPVMEEETPLELDTVDLPAEPVIAMGGPAPPVQAEAVSPPVPVTPPPVQSLPMDFDQPLAAFDPGALLDTPLAPPPPVSPLRRKPVRAPVFDDHERFETFELTPPVRPVATPAPAPIAAPETAASVHALLDRLERGIAQRGERAAPEPQPEPQPKPAPHSLQDTLDSLRRMAARA